MAVKSEKEQPDATLVGEAVVKVESKLLVTGQGKFHRLTANEGAKNYPSRECKNRIHQSIYQYQTV